MVGRSPEPEKSIDLLISTIAMASNLIDFNVFNPIRLKKEVILGSLK